MNRVDHIAGHTFHGRKGAIRNAFRYSVDYILLDPESQPATPALFSLNRANVTSWRERDHGGEAGQGRGAVWLRDQFDQMGVTQPDHITLLTQPRVFGHVFNPVSFWFCFDSGDQLYAVVAEVTNTYGTRHSYLCHTPNFTPIQPSDRIVADKLMHVSPFQKVEGSYTFRFDYRPDRLGVWIDYGRDGGGLIATLTGRRTPLTSRTILWSLLRRPFGARRAFFSDPVAGVEAVAEKGPVSPVSHGPRSRPPGFPHS